MNKKQNLLAIALSASFVLSGANLTIAAQNDFGRMAEPNASDKSVLFADGLEISGEKAFGIQRAPQESTDPNYASDEAKIKNFSASERYRTTQME